MYYKWESVFKYMLPQNEVWNIKHWKLINIEGNIESIKGYLFCSKECKVRISCALVGIRMHVQYKYCINIVRISVVLWGYVLIWYSCRDGMPAATMKTERGAFALHQKGKAMKVYFDKEGLIESLEFYRDNNARYFLFFSVSSVYPFVKYEEELAEINDYCLFVLCQLENKLKALIAESEGRFELVKGYRRKREYTAEELDVFF